MGKAVNTIAGGGLGSIVGSTLMGPVGGVIGGGLGAKAGGKNLLSSLGDTVLGKKSETIPDEVVDLASPTGRALQEQLLGQYGGMIGQDTSGIAATQIAGQESQARQLAKDQEMRAQQLVSQRGLGRTASGISQILGQSRGLGEQISGIRAQQPALAQQLKQQNLGFASSGINQILNEQGQSKVLKLGQLGGIRQGGIAPLLGAGAGALFGGAKGAQVGLGVGQAATQIG